MRAPIPVGSIADIVFLTERETTVEEVNSIFREEAESERYKGILGATAEQPGVISVVNALEVKSDEDTGPSKLWMSAALSRRQW